MLSTNEYKNFSEQFLNYLKTGFIPIGYFQLKTYREGILSMLTHEQRHQLRKDFNEKLRIYHLGNSSEGAMDMSVPKAALAGALIGTTPGFVAYQNNEGFPRALCKGVIGAVTGGILTGYGRFLQRKSTITAKEDAYKAIETRFQLLEDILPENYATEYLKTMQTSAENLMVKDRIGI